MVFDATLADHAYQYACDMAKSGQFRHASNLNALEEGENLAWRWSSADGNLFADENGNWNAKASHAWYQEIEHYNFEYGTSTTGE